MRGEIMIKGGWLRSMILPAKGMIFRKKNGNDKESIRARTYKSFFLEKSIKVSFFGAKRSLYL